MNPAPPVTSTFIVRFAVLGTSAREAASLPARRTPRETARMVPCGVQGRISSRDHADPRPDDVVPARRGRRHRDVRARRRGGAAAPGPRCASSRLRASAATGSPMGTAWSTTCTPRRGRRLRCLSSSCRSRVRRAVRRAVRTSSTRTGFRAWFPLWRRGSQSCSSSGGPMRHLRRAPDPSRDGSSAARES